MQRLSRSTLGFIGCAQTLSWFPALAQRHSVAASTILKQHLEHVFRSTLYGSRSIEVKSENLSKRCYTTLMVKPSHYMEESQIAIKDATQRNIVGSGTEDDTESPPIRATIKDIIKGNRTAIDDIWSVTIDPNSSHRDGTIYKKRLYWKSDYNIDITDRDETRVEPMRFAAATNNCHPDPDNCYYHDPCEMIQIFSLKLAKASINSGLIQLYGYIAARDDIDSKLNYVVNRSRDDPIIVQQGSLIEMTGPKRGIALNCDVLFEFDMRIKNGEQDENDLQLIDGVTEFCEISMPSKPFTVRINGDAGAVDMSLTNVYGVEATVEIFISEVENGFDLSISCVVSILEEPKEFQIFGAPIGESCDLRRFVIAVPMDTTMHLKFQIHQYGSNVVEHCCSFEAKMHGCASRDIKLGVSSLSVKVTWSTLID